VPIPPYIALLHRFYPLSPETVEAFEGIIRHRSLEKGAILLRIGHVSESIHFVVKGLGRVYYLRDGKDVTDYFATDGELIGAVESLFTGTPSHKGIELLEDSEIVSWKNRDFDDLCLKHHDLERAARKLCIMGMLMGQRRIESIRFLSARERYEELERAHPGITNRLPLKHVASYLGITPVSVSRIRAGLQ
jgi:CRP-like cAMP-binding protein